MKIEQTDAYTKFLDSLSKEKPKKTKPQKKNQRPKTTIEKEFKRLNVSLAEAHKTANNRTFRTLRDEWVLDSDGKSVLSETAERYRLELAKIVISKRQHKILTGRVLTYDTVADRLCAVVTLGMFDIYIPAFDFFRIDVNRQRQTDYDEFSRLLEARLNSEVDFVIQEVDEETATAVASRNEARLHKIRTYYLPSKEHNNKPIIQEGDIVKARVVATMKGGITVEVFGAEAFIPSKEIANNYVLNAKTFVGQGTKVDVMITDIYINREAQEIEINASMRKVHEAEYRQVKDNIKVGEQYTGTISAINQFGVFVIISIGNVDIDVLCKMPLYGLAPTVGANATITISSVADDRINGLIDHIAVGD